MMKVTVNFGQTGVVVPCKDGWTVRDLIQQATQRYRKILEQEGDFLVRTHHVEYCDGGILDPDDILSDLVEDKDKLMAVYEEQEAQQRGVTDSSLTPSPDLHQAEPSVFQPVTGGEIEVNSSALKSNTPLLVRSSSDSALSPQSTDTEPSYSEDSSNMAASPDVEGPTGMKRAQGKQTFSSSLTRTVEIPGEDSPLGIHVVPYCSSFSGRSLGLYIRGVEEESRSRKEGLFKEDECIVKINNTDLMDKTFSQSQDIFREAMRSPLVRLEVVSSSNRERYEKSLIGQLLVNSSAPNSSPHQVIKTKQPPPPVKAKPVFKPPENLTARVGEEPPVLEAVNSPKERGESPLHRKSPALSSLVSNKRGGRRLQIDLKKGSEGLGFTVVTRDSSIHGPGPILVKNILPRGAAVKDGRLQSGDRILEVNGVDTIGVGQEELVCMLRSTRQGETVSLVVLRQDEMFLPREMRDELSPVRGMVLESGKEQLMFEVPLNDTGSAGLGVSLKGNKSRETGEDLGIFIKSIIHGGAAYKDGRLHINDQLIAVNGESLLGRSNHAAMETLRRSMSQEGNVRGMIQLVVLRTLKDQYDVSPNRSFDSSSGLSGLISPAKGQASDSVQPPLVSNPIYSCSVTNGSYFHMDEEEDEGDLYRQDAEISSSNHRSFLQESETSKTSPVAQPQSPTQNQNQLKFQHIKPSKSMDLGTTQNQHHIVADESNVGSLDGRTSAAPSTPVELGPILGLEKSSSLESLQTAMSEVNKKNELLPFHRPRPNMVRGRGCNESFRAAIDKSYDGPAEDDDDEGSELSSGRDTPASSSSRQGLADHKEEKGKKEKNKKEKNKKTEKTKSKVKEKKKAEEPEETEKKSKKTVFALLRFGKKKEEKKEAKAALQRQKSDILSDLELERLKEDRERIEAGHPELREQLSREQPGGGGTGYPHFEDDDADPNYARIQSFRDREMGSGPPPLPQSPVYSAVQHAHARTPSPQGPPSFPAHGKHANEAGVLPDDDPLDRLYAKVNKPRGSGAASPLSPSPAPPHVGDSMDRIQLLRREYQQARREGMVPPYEELDPRHRGHDSDPHRIPGRGTDPRLTPRYEEVERQYASLPRRGPMDPAEYPMQPWSGHYPGPPPAQQGYHANQSPTYANINSQSGPSFSSFQPGPPYQQQRDPRGIEPGFYPHPSSQQRGPLRQDVPPSPTPPLRAPRYDSMARGTVGGGYRHQMDQSTDQYGYTGNIGGQQHQTSSRWRIPVTPTSSI
ncbi:partitioning defective 3 homolog B-like isoform X2 [Cyprinodon tularosa]|uniref:partitioning defective 3 homolog B-like isoform X2 n=1 Tax=Cyprinodon tularosa TaxID=77115 RepID=UPI0018E248B5|nr:partitioning defective 3 homolog B-like isoform X2 [Cyprinodon tularosa]